MSEQKNKPPVHPMKEANKRPLRFEVFKSDINGKTFFRLKSGNGEIVSDSQGYEDADSARETVKMIVANIRAGNFAIVDRAKEEA